MAPMEWAVVYLNDSVRAEVEALSPEHRAKFRRIVELMQSKGLEQVREPYVKHLEGGLWEMRLSGPSTIARAIYVAARGRRIVVLHAFVKKTEKTPRRALEIARARAKEVV
ncbi:MAG: type II toxin-antitoxin system RelE/ParE family toxin [Xanthobacteraceae bacterium]